MSAPATAVINGAQVRLSDCDWVLWQPCGCPRGVTMARYSRTEDAAWKSFFDTWKGIAEALRAAPGLRMELMTHERYVAEVSERMRTRCTHEKAATA